MTPTERAEAQGNRTMKAQLKNAAVTIATVLVGIYVLRQVSATRTLVDRALNG